MYTKLLNIISSLSNVLPPEYRQWNYIQSSGSQYINLNISQYTEVMCIASGSGGVFGGGAWGAYRRVHLNSESNKVILGNTISASGGSVLSVDIGADNKFTLLTSTTAHTLITSVASDTYSANTGWTSEVVYLFALNMSGSISGYFTGKIYRFKMYYNGVVVRDMYPCERKSDGVVGMYDIINDVFYTNQGTGVFGKG